MSEKIEKKEIDDFEEWYENQIWGNEDFKECLLQAWLGRAALRAESEPAWQPIETAPKDVSVLLYCNEYLPIYCGRKRYGNLGEPQQDVFAWRCDSSGRFANPTLWAHIPPAPQTTLNCGHIPTSSIELLGMWEPADFEGGSEEVRGPDWKLE
jgi:hypothetical protein